MNVKLIPIIATACILAFNSPAIAKNKPQAKTKTQAKKKPVVAKAWNHPMLSHAEFSSLTSEEQINYIRDLRKIVLDFSRKNPIVAQEMAKKNILFAALMGQMIGEANAADVTAEQKQKLDELIAKRDFEIKRLDEIKQELSVESDPGDIEALKRELVEVEQIVQDVKRDLAAHGRSMNPEPTVRTVPYTERADQRQSETGRELERRDRALETALAQKNAMEKLEREAKAKQLRADTELRNLQEGASGSLTLTEQARLETAKRNATEAKRDHQEAARDLRASEATYQQRLDDKTTARRELESAERAEAEAQRAAIASGTPAAAPATPDPLATVVNTNTAPPPPAAPAAPPATTTPQTTPTGAGDTADARTGDYRCMFGGFIIRGQKCESVKNAGESNYGKKLTNDTEIEVNGQKIPIKMSELKCSSTFPAQALCNPLLYGVKIGGTPGNARIEPFCVNAQKDTTSLCDSMAIGSCDTAGLRTCKANNSCAPEVKQKCAVWEISLYSAGRIALANPEAWNELGKSWDGLCGDENIKKNPYLNNRADASNAQKDVDATCKKASEGLIRIRNLLGLDRNGNPRNPPPAAPGAAPATTPATAAAPPGPVPPVQFGEQ